MIGPVIRPRRFAALYHEVTGAKAPPYVVSFYPYTSLKNTVRKRNGFLLFRLSDVQRDAPTELHEAVVVALLCSMFRKSLPPRYKRIQEEYFSQDQVQEAARFKRAIRETKRVVVPKGICYDLTEIYRELNEAYFDGKIEVKGIYWSPGRSIRRLGYWDSAHRIIVISRRLDSSEVPDYVVRYIVFHEMLHVALPSVTKGRRTHHHTGEFKEAEQKFVDYDRAKWFIENKLARE